MPSPIHTVGQLDAPPEPAKTDPDHSAASSHPDVPGASSLSANAQTVQETTANPDEESKETVGIEVLSDEAELSNNETQSYAADAIGGDENPSSDLDATTGQAADAKSDTVNAANTASPSQSLGTTSGSSSCCSHLSSLDKNLGLPARLSRALSSTEYSGSPYTFSEYQLPVPGLRVHGMPEPLGFPLVPSQAEELAKLATICPHGRGLETVIDSEVRDCLQVEPEMVTFENQEWSLKLDALFNQVCFELGVPQNAVKHDLYKLLLYRQGGHFKSHVDLEKTQGMFATCTIQLPSHFKGGKVVFRHDGREEALSGGADDGTNRFKFFYSAFYADVQHEIRPIEEGYRITLVYNLSWVGNGTVPSANPVALSEVRAALKEHADNSPYEDWDLAFMLEHEYTSSSISAYGTGALKGVDRQNVGALSVAAESLGIGELDVVLCRLEQVLDVRGEEESVPLKLQFMAGYELQVLEKYWDTGKTFSGSMDWVNWDFLSFSKIKEKGPVPTGNEGVQIETTYGAMAVVVWARKMRIEALFRGCSYDVWDFLAEGDPRESSAARADRILRCLQRGYACEDYWDRANAVLKFCFEGGLHEQASQAIKLATGLPYDEDIEMVLYKYLSRYGWDVIGDAVAHYLCHSSDQISAHKIEPLLTMFQSLPWIPTDIAVEGLGSFMKTVEYHYPELPRECRFSSCGFNRGKARKRVWVLVMSLIAHGEQQCRELDADMKTALDSIVTRVAVLLGAMSEMDLEPIYSILSQKVVAKPSKHLEELHSIVRNRFLTLRRDRFEKDASYIIGQKTVGHYGDGYDEYKVRQEHKERYDYRSNEHRERDWSEFLSLCAKALLGGVVPSSSRTMFQKLLESLQFLPRREIDALTAVVAGLRSNEEEERTVAMVEDEALRARERIYEREPVTTETPETSATSDSSAVESDQG